MFFSTSATTVDSTADAMFGLAGAPTNRRLDVIVPWLKCPAVITFSAFTITSEAIMAVGLEAGASAEITYYFALW